MNLLMEIITVFLSAALLENMVLSRALGVSHTTLVQEDRPSVMVFSFSVLFMCTVSSVLGWLVRFILTWGQFSLSLFVKQAILFLPVLISYFLMYLLVSLRLPGLMTMFDNVATYAAFNGAVYGSLLVSFAKELGFLPSLAHGLGAGCGMVLASLLILCGHRRMNTRDIPKAFRGIPIMLLYIGILALALYGLTGHNLPT